MTEETPIVSLKEYFDQRMEAMDEANRERANLVRVAIDAALASADKAITAALAAAEKAVLKAEAAQEKRMEGLNEFRAAMMDQQKGLAPKAETDLRFETFDKRITEIREEMVRGVGRNQGVGLTIGSIVQALSTVVLVGAVMAIVFGK